MTATTTGAMHRLVDFLGELAPRLGLPAAPCRVHGYLYLRARPTGEDELRKALCLGAAALDSAIVEIKRSLRYALKGTLSALKCS